MAYECFVPKRFGASSMKIIGQADDICKEYMQQGFTLTLRQLYYQFVARALLENKQTEYKRLGSILNDARLAGLIDWDSIEDRTRNLEYLNHWDSPRDIIEASASQFRYDRWKTQPLRCEVWVEKEALVGVVQPTCDQFRVPYFACRGNTSQSELYSAAKRFTEYAEEGQTTIIFHLGDHDPNGIDMTRDNQDRLNLMWDGDAHPENVEVRRLALNMDQIKKYRPPPNPAKTTDSRYIGYAAKYGDQSWELDALDPNVIANLLRTHIEANIDDGAWQEAIAEEKAARERLTKVAKNWKD